MPLNRNRHICRLKAIVLGASCALLGVALAEDYAYQMLTNLAPYTSSRVLLMNNDVNGECPIGWYTNGVCISGQGYYDTNDVTTAVGGTFWWHEGTAAPGGPAGRQMNLLRGIEHILYQKTDEVGGKKPLWTLKQCRAGSGAYSDASRSYLPWSETCVPIGPTYTTMPIQEDANGRKQAAHVCMRVLKGSESEGAYIYSPFYEEGIGFIFFDAVNGWQKPDGLCESAWETMSSFVMALAHGAENFYDGWMKNPKSAMLSCNDGFRPVSFLIEALDEEAEVGE